jgi:predicted XRE-type DNA-binding protein
MKIKSIEFNNRKKGFEIKTMGKTYWFPYAKLAQPITTKDPIVNVRIDEELDDEGFTYFMASGNEGTVHIEQVLDYNKDPSYLRDMILYKLTLDAQRQISRTSLSRREIIRRLGTSAPQLYRLLDQTNYKKSLDQMLILLNILDCDIDVIVKAKSA